MQAIKSAATCFFLFTCACDSAEKPSMVKRKSDYYDDSPINCGVCFPTDPPNCSFYEVKRSELSIAEGRFNLKKTYDSRKPEEISGTVSIYGDTILFAADSSKGSSWLMIRRIKYNFTDSALVFIPETTE